MAAVLYSFPWHSWVAFQGNSSPVRFNCLCGSVLLASGGSTDYPVMAAYWLKAKPPHHTSGKLTAAYESALSGGIEAPADHMHLRRAVLCRKCMAVSSAAYLLVSRIDRGESNIKILLPPGSSIGDTIAAVDRVTAVVRQRQEVDTIFDTVAKMAR